MRRTQRIALLALLNDEMYRQGSWCGETHIQKATYLLQDLLGVQMGFEFILYRHGPFSFDLRDELVSMQADQILELAMRRPGYGPSYLPTDFGEAFMERYPNTLSRYREQIQFIAKELGDQGVAELEKLATAFFIADRQEITEPDDRAHMLVELKPHVSLFDARVATDQADNLVKRSRHVRIEDSE